MKKIVRKVSALAVTAVMFSTLSMDVSAAGLKDLFDEKLYAAENPDVVAVVGDSKNALYDHYVKYGIAEDRVGSLVFDVKTYREMYGDLNAAFGDNWDAYAKHYLTLGLKEEREGGGEFDAVSYAKRYPDVYKAYGLDISKLQEHYEAFGEEENRVAITETELEEQIAIAAGKAEAAEREAEEEAAKVKGVDSMTFVKIHNAWSAAVEAYFNYKGEMDDSPDRAVYAEQYNAAYKEFDVNRDEVLANGTQYDIDVLHNIYYGILDAGGYFHTIKFPESLKVSSN